MSKRKYKLVKYDEKIRFKSGETIVISKDGIKKDLNNVVEDFVNNELEKKVRSVEKGFRKNNKIPQKTIENKRSSIKRAKVKNKGSVIDNVVKAKPLAIRFEEKDSYKLELIKKRLTIIKNREGEIKEFRIVYDHIDNSFKSYSYDFKKGLKYTDIKKFLINASYSFANSPEYKDDYFMKNIMSMMYYRIKKEYKKIKEESIKIKLKPLYMAAATNDMSKLTYERLEKYIIDKTMYNLIDLGKVEHYNSKKKNPKRDVDSKLLEQIKREDKLYKSFSIAIADAFDSFNTYNAKNQTDDIFGSNRSFSDLSDEGKDAITQFVKNKLGCDIFSIEVDGEYTNILIQNFVNLRSAVIHKKIYEAKKKEKLDKLFSNKLDYELNKLFDTLKNKYISNQVHYYYSIKDFKEVFEISFTNESIILDKNFMPRFSTIHNLLSGKSRKNDLYASTRFNYAYTPYNENMNANIFAQFFLLREIYKTSFRKYLSTTNFKGFFDTDTGTNIKRESIEGYLIKKHKKMFEDIRDVKFQEISHSDAFAKLMSLAGDNERQINAYKNVWHLYLSYEFDQFITKNFNFILKPSSTIIKEDEPFSNYTNQPMVEKELDIIKNMFNALLPNVKYRMYVVYLLSFFLTNDTLNKLKTSFISYAQFIVYEETMQSEDDIIKSFGDISPLVKILTITQENSNKYNIDEDVLDIYNNFFKHTTWKVDSKNNIFEGKKMRSLVQLKEDKFTNLIHDKYITQEDIDFFEKFQAKKDELNQLNDKLVKEMSKYNIADKMKKPCECDEEFINCWNERLEYSYYQNKINLFNILNHKHLYFELNGVLSNLFKAIEQDLIYILYGYSKVMGEQIISKQNDFELALNKAGELAMFNFQGYCLDRNQIAHMQLFNPTSGCSMYLMIKRMFNYLMYNPKRKKSFKEALIYVFSKYNLTATFEFDHNNNGEFKLMKIESQIHPKYEKLGINSSWEKIKLTSQYEVNDIKTILGMQH